MMDYFLIISGFVLITTVFFGVFIRMRMNAQKRDRNHVTWFELQLSGIDRPYEGVQMAFVNLFASIGRNGWKRKLLGSMGFRFFFVGEKQSVKIYACVPTERKFQFKQSIESIYPGCLCTDLKENPLEKLVTMDGYAAAMKARKEKAPFQPFSSKQIPVLDQILGVLKTQEQSTVFSLSIFADSPKKLKRKEGEMPLVNLDQAGDAFERGLHALGQELLGKYNIFEFPEDKKGEQKSNTKNKELQKVFDQRESLSQRAFQVVPILYAKGSNAKRRVHTIASQFSGMHLVNSFKPVKKGRKLIHSMYNGKFPTAIKSLMATSELAHLLQIPHQEFRSWPLAKEVRKYSAEKGFISKNGLLIGTSNAPGPFHSEKIRLLSEAFLSHGYIEASPGSGKTNLLASMIVDMIHQQLDEKKGKIRFKTPRESTPGVTMFDPHGDAVEKILTHLPPELYEDTYYIQMSDRDFPRAFNVYDMDGIDVESIADIFVKSMMDLYPAGNAVRMENFLKNGVLTLLKSGEEVTALNIPLLFTDPKYRKEILDKVRVKDPFQLEFWNGSFQAEANNIDKVMGPIWNRLNNLISFDLMRNMFGQPKTFVSIRKLMDEGKNLFINAAGVGPDNMKLFAAWLLIQYHFTALSRYNIPEEQRRGHLFFGDECHGWLSQVAANIVDEDRKYGLGLWMSTQYSDQIENKRLLNSILRNVGNHIALRSKQENAQDLARRVGVKTEDIINLPDNAGYGQLLMQEGYAKSSHVVSFENPYLEKGEYDPKPFKDLSNQRDGRKREEVEQEMRSRYRLNITPEEESPVPSQRFRSIRREKVH